MIKNYSELLVLAVMHLQTSEAAIAKATNIGNIKRWKQQMLKVTNLGSDKPKKQQTSEVTTFKKYQK